MKTTLNIAGERVTVTAFGDETCAGFGDASVAPNAVESRVPFVYMHEIQDESDAVLKRCAELGCPPFVLVAIHVSQWNDMLTPWECPGIFADDAPFAGHAKRQLEALSEIAQKTEERLGVRPAHRCIAGYSLAGLFATWAPFQTDLFDAVASASGSMWYPNFAEYVEAGTFHRSPRCAYFSLGSKEARRAAFCAAWPTARSALSLPLRRKASKPFSKAIRATISKSPMCAWRRRFAGRFRIAARIRHRNRGRAS